MRCDPRGALRRGPCDAGPAPAAGAGRLVRCGLCGASLGGSCTGGPYDAMRSGRTAGPVHSVPSVQCCAIRSVPLVRCDPGRSARLGAVRCGPRGRCGSVGAARPRHGECRPCDAARAQGPCITVRAMRSLRGGRCEAVGARRARGARGWWLVLGAALALEAGFGSGWGWVLDGVCSGRGLGLCGWVDWEMSRLVRGVRRLGHG